MTQKKCTVKTFKAYFNTKNIRFELESQINKAIFTRSVFRNQK